MGHGSEHFVSDEGVVGSAGEFIALIDRGKRDNPGKDRCGMCFKRNFLPGTSEQTQEAAKIAPQRRDLCCG